MTAVTQRIFCPKVNFSKHVGWTHERRREYTPTKRTTSTAPPTKSGNYTCNKGIEVVFWTTHVGGYRACQCLAHMDRFLTGQWGHGCKRQSVRFIVTPVLSFFSTHTNLWYSGIVAACGVFIVTMMLHTNLDSFFTRPHPAIWRAVRGLAILYLMFLIFLLHQVKT